MLTESLILGVFILALRKQLLNFAKLAQYRFLALPIGAFLIEVVASRLLENQGPYSKVILEYTFILELVCYGLLVVFALSNRQVRGFKLMAIGLILNGAVVLSNGGFMPVEGSVLKEMGFLVSYESLSQLHIFAHRLVDESTQLVYLGDIFHLAPPYPFPKSISIGDLVMGFGVLYHLSTYRKPLALEAEGGKEAVL